MCGWGDTLKTTWTSSNNVQHSYDLSVDFDGLNFFPEYWVSLDNWDNIKEAGSWDVHGQELFYDTTGPYDTSFTVVPEPISSILFVAGGTFLAGRRYKKRMKKA